MPLQKLSDASRRGVATTVVEPRVASGYRADNIVLLPSELGAQTLAPAKTADVPQLGLPRQAAKDDGQRDDEDRGPVKVYRWTEFFGKEHTTEFDDSHFKLDGHFESNSSAGHKEYQDRIRAIHFRKEGKNRAEIARLLGRSEKFVTKWWQKHEKEVPRPWGVHEYLTKEMGQRTFNQQATVTGDTTTSTASWWRDVEVKRKYHVDPAIYEELLASSDWKSNVARTRDFSTGASHLKYDKEGKTKTQSNQGAKYARGQSPAMDKLLQKFFAEYGIADRTSGIALNWYPDGNGALGSHRHDCWTALFSFGYERILTIDKTPLLCQDGDLVIFGTQRHGVPFMPEITEGRITVPIFFYPDHLQMKKQWQMLTDPEDPRISRELAKLKFENTFTTNAADTMLWTDPARTHCLEQLLQLGFEEGPSRVALSSCGFDVEQAAELLLGAGYAAPTELRLDDREPACLCDQSFPFADAAQGAPRSRWKARAVVKNDAQPTELVDTEDADKSAADGTVHECEGPHEQEMQTAGEDLDEDVAFALQLQLEEENRGQSMGFAQMPAAVAEAGADDDTLAALAAQWEEEEKASARFDPGLLEDQFREYEEQFKRDDAEEWHGHGDLMQSGRAREALSLKSMDKTTCYSIGHGRLPEKDFYEVLSLNSIRVLYDFRASDHRGDVHAPCQRFAVRALKATCKARGIFYKHIALGRESAYGILAHIASDEAEHALIELVWHAKRKRTAFLGFDEDWRLDHRQVIAEELTKLGHFVRHISSDGSYEDHKIGWKLPDFILQEEEKLRKLEKMRQAGELKRPEKSAVDRSTEAVASRLARPAETVDAMDELRAAGNQTELVQIQRKLARVQRIAEKKGLMANKVLTDTPQWILEEAREQEAWIAQKKAEKLQSKNAAATGSSAKPVSQDVSAPDEAEDLVVECAGCGKGLPWAQLAGGDGRCTDCCHLSAVSSSSCGAPAGSSSSCGPGLIDEEAAAEALVVECGVCTAPTPWRLLQLGDGVCPGCARQSADVEPACLDEPAATSQAPALASLGPEGGSAFVGGAATALSEVGKSGEGAASAGDGVNGNGVRAGAGARSSWRARRRQAATDAA